MSLDAEKEATLDLSTLLASTGDPEGTVAVGESRQIDLLVA